MIEVREGTMHINHLDIAALSVADRIDLAQKLWESVHQEIEASPLTPDQVAEVERRIADIDTGRVRCIPFDAVLKRLSHR